MNRSAEDLTGAVQNVLDRLGEIPHGLLAAVFLIVGLSAAATSIYFALICDPACRRPWAAITGTCLLWTAGYIGLLFGMPAWCISLGLPPRDPGLRRRRHPCGPGCVPVSDGLGPGRL